METRFEKLLSLLLLLTLPAVVEAQWSYTTNNGSITITQYSCSDASVTIPDTIDGLPVTSIGTQAFQGCVILTNVTLGNQITSIGDWAFYECPNLSLVPFANNALTTGA